MTDSDATPGTGDPAASEQPTSTDPVVSSAGSGVSPISGSDGQAPDADGPLAVLEREGDIAADYLEELLDIADLDGDIDIDVDGDRAVVSLVGGDLDHLVGADGAVLTALQDLTRLAVTRETDLRSRLVVDVAGYRERRRAEITALVSRAADQVRDGATAVPLPAMGAFERKIAHDAVAALGLASDSEGEDPQRHVVVRAS